MSVPSLPGRVVLKVALVVIVGAVLALLAWATLAAGQGRTLVSKIAAGQEPPAPAFELEGFWPTGDRWPPELAPALRDGKLSLSELRGRPVVLNFWASWCIPCRDEAPILAASAHRYVGAVRFVGIDVRDLRTDALAFLREFEVPYVSVRDEADRTYRAYGLTGVPETFYVDARGQIVAHTPGPISADSLEGGISAALEKR